MPDDDAPKPQVLQPVVLPPLGDYRPSRVEDTLADGAVATIPLELSPNPASTDPAPAETSIELAPANPDTAPTHTTARHPLRRTASLAVAGGAHVLVLLALVSAPPLEFGYGGTARDAISVSIVPASAIDARQASADASAQAAPSQIAPDPGEDTTTSEATPEKIASPKEIEQPSRDQTVPDTRLAAPSELAPEVVPDEAPEIATPPKPPEEVKVATVEPPPAPVPRQKPLEDAPREEAPTSPSPAAQASGGATSHGAAPDQSAQPAAAAASPGDVDDYGTAVQTALLAVDQREAKARASALRAKGTVVVRLSIDAQGGLVSAEIVKSSGRVELDDAAILLIRLAAFPPPPQGLTSDQRTYIAPIRFQ